MTWTVPSTAKPLTNSNTGSGTQAYPPQPSNLAHVLTTCSALSLDSATVLQVLSQPSGHHHCPVLESQLVFSLLSIIDSIAMFCFTKWCERLSVLLDGSNALKNRYRWSSPGEFLVDGVVNVLKRTRRWSRDGRSLRRLNRYWCLQLNRHVVSVYPYKNREIKEQDIASLLKFSRLTSLDLSPFCGKHEDRIPERCRRTMDVLGRLRHLRSVTMDGFVLSGLEREQLMQLPITSITLSAAIVIPEDLPKLHGLPIKELRGNYVNVHPIAGLLRHTPTLRRLDFFLQFGTDDSLDAFSDLEEIKIWFGGGIERQMSVLTPLASLHLFRCVHTDIEPLSQLANLRQLDLRAEDGLEFDDGFMLLMKQLTYLGLSAEICRTRLPFEFWQSASSLTTLKITRFRIETSILERCSFPSLSKLLMAACSIGPTPLSFRNLTGLTTLGMGGNVDDNRHGIQVNVDLHSLEHLKVLFFSFCTDERLTSEMILRLCQRKRLESLTLSNALEFSNLGSFPFKSLENLGSLPNLSEFELTGLANQKTLDRIMGLKFLTTLEEVALEVFVPLGGGVWKRGSTSKLAKAAPHLKIKY